MRASKLITRLTNLCIRHGDPKVGFTGHYGEFYELDWSDVYAREVTTDEYRRPIKPETVINIDAPNIGEEPD